MKTFFMGLLAFCVNVGAMDNPSVNEEIERCKQRERDFLANPALDRLARRAGEKFDRENKRPDWMSNYKRPQNILKNQNALSDFDSKHVEMDNSSDSFMGLCSSVTPGQEAAFYAIMKYTRNLDYDNAERVLQKSPSVVNFRNNDGNTLLHLATIQKNIMNIDLFLKYGANPDLKGSDKETCLQSIVKSSKDLRAGAGGGLSSKKLQKELINSIAEFSSSKSIRESINTALSIQASFRSEVRKSLIQSATIKPLLDIQKNKDKKKLNIEQINNSKRKHADDSAFQAKKQKK